MHIIRGSLFTGMLRACGPLRRSSLNVLRKYGPYGAVVEEKLIAV